jgi:rare lipoprotein A
VTYYPLSSSVGYEEEGIASWYGEQFHGRKTSNGEKYDMYGRTAAHKTLPFNTFLLVTNLENGRKAVVRVNDRGPFVNGRIVDLTLTVAKELRMDQTGTARVRIAAMAPGDTDQYGNVYVTRPLVDFNEGRFTVQVGSFISRENAVRLHSQLKSEYGFASIDKFAWGNDVFYRVRVGRYNNLEKARQSLRAWNRRGYPGSFVVAEN